MDIGDIVRLLFLAFIFLSFFGGLFGRNREESQDEQGNAPRPTDIFESGGQDQPRQQPQQRPQERQMPTTAAEWWEELTGQGMEQPQPQQPREPERQVVTYDDALEAEQPEADRAERAEQRRERATASGSRGSVRAGEQEMLGEDLTDMPASGDASPRRRRPVEIGTGVQLRSARTGSGSGRSRTTGGDVLRRSLRSPDNLERAFILKEVLDEPLGLRKDDQAR